MFFTLHMRGSKCSSASLGSGFVSVGSIEKTEARVMKGDLRD